MSSSSQVITEYGKQNIFARETPPQLVDNYTSYPKEAEKTNGRWAMIAASTIPLIESKTRSPAIHEFDKLPANLQLGIVGFILMGEGASMLKGWKNPFENGTSNYFKLEDDYQPGDLGFEISNHDDVDLHNKELNNGRLAMIAAAGMIAQELVTNKPLLFSDTLW